MKELKLPSNLWPYGSTSIPTFRGWRGVIISHTKKNWDPIICWTCNHEHLYKDNAEHCAGVVRRQWLRELAKS